MLLVSWLFLSLVLLAGKVRSSLARLRNILPFVVRLSELPLLRVVKLQARRLAHRVVLGDVRAGLFRQALRSPVTSNHRHVSRPSERSPYQVHRSESLGPARFAEHSRI